MPKRDLAALKASREREQYILDARDERVNEDWITDWKQRTAAIDNLAAGNLAVAFPDENVKDLPPAVMNIVEVGLTETARLTAEAAPTLRSEPESDADDDVLKAYKREAAGQTHWIANHGEESIVPYVTLDHAATGLAFVAVSPGNTKRGMIYPKFTVIDPRGTVPEFVNDELVTLLVVTRMQRRQLARFLGEDEGVFSETELTKCTEVELLQWYDDEMVQCQVALKDSFGNAYAAAAVPSKDWVHGLGEIPVGFMRNPTHDRAFRGYFDQIKDVFLNQNRIFQLQVDYADQQVYSPWLAIDIENDTDPAGPNTIYRGRSEMSRMQRVAPAGSNPQLFALLEYLSRNARGGIGMPETRQGEVGVSQGSASFIHATQGQLTSQIKHGQRGLARLRRDLHRLAAKVDRKDMNTTKPLLIASGRFGTYKPSELWRPVENFTVTYGAGAGLDAVSRKQAVAADISIGLASIETGMEQTDYILDVPGEIQKKQKEQVEAALLQRLITDPQVGSDLLMRLLERMYLGKRIGEAAQELASIEEQARVEQQAAAGAPAGGGAPPQEGAPVTAEQLAAGAQGGAPGTGGEVNLPAPASAQVIVRQ